MKIPIMKFDSLQKLKLFIKDNLIFYQTGKIDLIAKNDDFIEIDIPLDNVQLDFNHKTTGENDYNHIIKFYNGFRNLTRSQAVEERLWAGLCHSTHWQYLQRRWPIKINDPIEKKIKSIENHYFFGDQGKQRSLLLNGLSRLWWYGNMFHDDSRDDSFELLRFISKDINVRGFMLLGSNFSNNKRVIKTLIEECILYEKYNKVAFNTDRKYNHFEQVRKRMNLLAGSTNLEILSDSFLRAKIKEYINDVFKVTENFNTNR